jgi:hypothetical protein
MAINKDRIKEMLGSGLGPDVVSGAIGCDPSYISQLMADQKFADEVIALRSAALTANTARDRRIDVIEDQLLEKLEESVPLIYKPNEILRAAAVVNSMKRRGLPAQDSIRAQGAVVTLVVPIQVVHQFVTNTKGEVIEADGQTLVTKPSHELLRELATGKNGEKYDRVSRFLPGSTHGGVSNGSDGAGIVIEGEATSA